MNDLYLKDQYTNKNIISLFNKTIIEYDIESAGLNLLIKYKLLDSEITDKLKTLPKKERVYQIGLLQKKYPGLNKQLNDSFKEIRKVFFEENELERDDIISIKKDAIFVSRELEHTIFDNVKFKPKNRYTSYINLGSLEFYYNEDKLDIKGLTSEQKKIDCHEEYLIDFIKKYFKKMEYGTKEEQLKFIRYYIDKYKKRELPLGFYRTFNRDGVYEILDEDDGIIFSDYWEDKKDELNISYNYNRIFIPFAKIVL